MARGQHVRQRGRSAIAIVTGCVLLACSVLALHHEGDVAHVVDATGTSIHAATTDCHEAAGHTHMHELPGSEHRDFGACALTALAHQAATTPDRPALVATTSQYAIASPIIAIGFVESGSPLLHVAPKTSPPRA